MGKNPKKLNSLELARVVDILARFRIGVEVSDDEVEDAISILEEVDEYGMLPHMEEDFPHSLFP